MLPRLHTTRPLSRSTLVFLALILFIVIASPAQAAITPCRGDPIVETIMFRVQSVVEVYTDLANIQRVDYVYRVPLGKALPVLFDASPLAAKETAAFVSNNGSGVIQIDAVVVLKAGVAPVPVTTTTTITSKLTGNTITKTASGLSGQVLSITNQR